jgi:transposase
MKASSELERAQAFTRVACGESIRAVAADIGRSHAIVHMWCREAGLVDIPHYRGAAHKERQNQADKRRQDASEMARDGYSNAEIANFLGISISSVSLYTNGIVRTKRATRR